ncbi:MAG: hypothetical protein IKW39_01610 [Alphaproteobacteria bacterium]|nr:hypothetical protein [Alphaproteobacteria bacterium]
MCSTITPADFILGKIKNGLPYDESIKKLLILALDEQTYELRMSSEVVLFSLPDAKELLTHYLQGSDKKRDKDLWLTINGEATLIEKPEYEDLLFEYVSKRPLDEEVQELIFTHKNAKKLLKYHFEKQGLAPNVKRHGEELKWI